MSIVDQPAHALQRPRSPKYLNAIDRLPSRKGRYQPAQAENVVEVSVSKQNPAESLESQPAAQDLSLGTLSAVHEEAIVLMKDYLRRETPLDRWGGGGGAQEDDLDHRPIPSTNRRPPPPEPISIPTSIPRNRSTTQALVRRCCERCATSTSERPAANAIGSSNGPFQRRRDKSAHKVGTGADIDCGDRYHRIFATGVLTDIQGADRL